MGEPRSLKEVDPHPLSEVDPRPLSEVEGCFATILEEITGPVKYINRFPAEMTKKIEYTDCLRFEHVCCPIDKMEYNKMIA